MNFDAQCLLPSGMTYEPPAAWNWCGPMDNGCTYYSPQQPEPTFGLQFGQQPRATFFQDIGISPYTSPGEVDYCPSSTRLALLGNGANHAAGRHGNGSLGIKDEPHQESSNDSARCYVEPSRPLTGGSNCDRTHTSDPMGTMQCASSSSSSTGNLMDISSSHGHSTGAVKAPTTPVPAQVAAVETNAASRKKRDRFNGMTDEEVLKLTVPDQMCENLDMVIIGISPGMTAAYLGHHYAGPGNHFWKCLYLSGLIPEPMNANDDYRLKEIGIGFTNFVSRCSKGSVELTRREMKEGAEILTAKIQRYRPKIAVFNGKGIYEMFCNHKNFYIGKQPEPFPGTETVVYVMPSSSARCSQLPRASDKVPFFVALRKLRDHVCGRLARPLDESEVVFPDLDLKVEPRRDRRQPSTSTAGSTSDPTERKRHYGDDEFPPTSSSCDLVPSPPHWQRQATPADMPSWPSTYPSFGSAPGLTDCNYGGPKLSSESSSILPYSGSSGLNDPGMSFGWNNVAGRWPTSVPDYAAAYAKRMAPIDRPTSFLPDVTSNSIVPKSAYGALPPYPSYPYDPSFLTSSAGGTRGMPGFGLMDHSAAAMMNAAGRSQAAAAFDVLSSCSPMLRCYPQ